MNPFAGHFSRTFPPRSVRGFSLVEVVIALGIVSFSLIAIIGLLPAGLTGEKQSRDDTHMTHIASTIFSALQSRKVFDTKDSSGTVTSIPLLTSASGVAYYSTDEILVAPNDPANPFAYIVTAKTAGSTIASGVTVGALILTVTLTITPQAPTLGLSPAPSTSKNAQTFVQLIGNF